MQSTPLEKIKSFLSLENSIYTVIILGAFLFVLKTPPIYFPDSRGYLEMIIYRSCGYPFFLEAHRLIFGSYFIPAVIFTQFAVNILAALFLVRCIRKTTGLDKWLAMILFGLMIFPMLAGVFTANTILSEGIAYPLYLTAIGCMLIGVAFKNNGYLYSAIGVSFVLILVRGQFLFVVPILLAAILLTHYNALFKLKTILLMVSAVSIFFLSILTDIIFHKICHNKAVTTPLTGVQIITIPFFVADENDYTIFKTKQEQEYFKVIYGNLKKKNLLYSQLPDDGKQIRFFFDKYTEICNLTIYEGYKLFPATKSVEERLILNDELTSKMTVPLLKDNFKNWLRMYSANFMKGFDTSKYFLLYLLILIISTITLLKKENKLSKIFILFVLLPIANISLVSIAESTIGRYTFYNNWILFGIFLILFQHQFYNKINE